MLTTIEGTFRNGKVELAETPSGHDGSRVLVTFLPIEPVSPGQMISYGMLRSDTGRESTWEDFLEAKRALQKAGEEQDGGELRH